MRTVPHPTQVGWILTRNRDNRGSQEHHGLRPEGKGRWIEIVLWADDTDAAVNALVARGAPLLSPAHDFLEGRLRAAWIADPDGNLIQLVQRKG